MFFRGLGGAVGAAVLGAVFAARTSGATGRSVHELSTAARADLIDGVQTVLLCAAPVAMLGLLVTLLLHETPLRGSAPQTTEIREETPV
jgi:hypothetical protein